jgi:hypothetical protein
MPIVSGKFLEDSIVTCVGLSTCRKLTSTSGRFWLSAGMITSAAVTRSYQVTCSQVSLFVAL